VDHFPTSLLYMYLEILMYTTVMPAPETDRLVTVTPKGRAVRAAYHFLAALRLLPADECDDVMELLALEFGDQPA
jgi:hypothetical protein